MSVYFYSVQLRRSVRAFSNIDVIYDNLYFTKQTLVDKN